MLSATDLNQKKKRKEDILSRIKLTKIMNPHERVNCEITGRVTSIISPLVTLPQAGWYGAFCILYRALYHVLLF